MYLGRYFIDCFIDVLLLPHQVTTLLNNDHGTTIHQTYPSIQQQEVPAMLGKVWDARYVFSLDRNSPTHVVDATGINCIPGTYLRV